MADPTVSRKTGAYYPDGREIPKEDLPAAIAKDQARWVAGTKVPMVAPDGSGWEIPSESAREQLAKGWRPRDAQEHALAIAKQKPASIADVLDSAAAGFIEGVVPGGRLLTDQLMTPQERELMLARAPLVHGAAEVAGFVAPMIATGGTSAAAKGGLGALARGAGRLATAPARGLAAAATGAGEFAARGVTSGIAKRAVSMGVASGIEGATYAAGNELARQARGNEDFNAEAFASSLGEGALFGVVAGGALGGAGSLVARGAKKGADAYRGLMRGMSGAEEAAAGVAGRIPESHAWAGKAMGISPGQIKNVGVDKFNTAMREVLDTGIIKKEGVWAAGAENLVSKADKFNKAFKELGDVHIPGVYKEADALLGKMPNMHATANAVDALSSTSQLMRKEAVVRTLTDRTAMLYDKGGEYAKVARNLESSWLEPLQKARTIDDLHSLDMDLRKKAESLKPDSIGGSETAMLRGDLKSKIRELIGEVSPELGTKLRKLDATYEAFAAVRKPITDAAASTQAKTVSGLTPYEATLGAGGLAFGTPGIGAVLAGAHAAVRHLKGSERFAAGMARATDAAANVATKKRFTISGAIKSAAERSPVKITPGTPGRLVALTRDYHEKTDAAKQAVTNPQPTLMRLANNLAPLARVNPDQARRMAELYSNDLAWLASRVPPSFDVGEDLDFLLQSATARSQAVPPSAAAKFVRISNALADPLKEVEKVGSKKELPAPETAEILRERRPETRNQVEKEFDLQALKLAEKGQKMPYKTRIQASLLTGKPYDPSMRPVAIKFTQGHWAARLAPDAPVSGSGGGGGTRRGRVTQTTRGRVTRFNTTAQQTMEPSDL